MSCRSCHLDLRSTTFVRCRECKVPSVELCVPCFSGGYKNSRHWCGHRYSIISGDLLRDCGSKDASVSSCLSILDGSRRYSIGAWSDVNSRLSLESYQECESIFMTLYELWSNMSGDPFPIQRYSLDESALVQSTIHNDGGMFVDALQIPESSDLPGFLRQRVDFDIEFDDSAELILADLEFSESDTQDDLAYKLAALRSYTERIYLRESVKTFAVRNDLLNYQDQANSQRYRTAEESDLRGKLRPFQRFFTSRDQFEDYVHLALYEERLRLRLTRLESQDMNASMVNDTPVTGKETTNGDKDVEDSRPTTRSRSGLETRRGTRALEDDCNKIREHIANPTTSEALANGLSSNEREILAQLGIPLETFALLRNAELARCDELGVPAVECVLTRYGRTFSLESRN